MRFLQFLGRKATVLLAFGNAILLASTSFVLLGKMSAAEWSAAQMSVTAPLFAGFVVGNIAEHLAKKSAPPTPPADGEAP